MKGMPAVEKYDEQFQFLLPDGTPMPHIHYKIYPNDEVLEGKTTTKGLSNRVHTEKQQELRTELGWIDFHADQPLGDS